MVDPEDSIKLLLEAFQMSVGACIAHPTVAMLHEQLLGRLMLVRKDTQVLSETVQDFPQAEHLASALRSRFT